MRQEKMMLKVLYEDKDIIVVVKPAGVESQAAKKFAPDMISEIKKHMVINKLCTPGKEPYVAVIHRLDKPVSGVMVYAKTKKAAAALSEQVQNRKMDKYYEAVVCGKLVDNVENPVYKFVDYLQKSVDGNYSQVVDKGITDAKRAELTWERKASVEIDGNMWNLVRIHLLTGRHHQIRVQFAHHGLPLYGDARYNPDFDPVNQAGISQAGISQTGINRAAAGQAGPAAGAGISGGMRRGRQIPLALCAVSLAFDHPETGKRMEFSMEPSGGAFSFFGGRV